MQYYVFTTVLSMLVYRYMNWQAKTIGQSGHSYCIYTILVKFYAVGRMRAYHFLVFLLWNTSLHVSCQPG